MHAAQSSVGNRVRHKMPRFLKMSHDKGLDNVRTMLDDSPIVSNMIPEEKFREEDMVGTVC
jgi:hypothetical protein